jgi:hypothetical protein
MHWVGFETIPVFERAKTFRASRGVINQALSHTFGEPDTHIQTAEIWTESTENLFLGACD